MLGQMQRLAMHRDQRSSASPSRYISSSSARRGWPETWTRCVRSVMTSMPWSISPLMMRPTAFSLPGMVRDGKDHPVAARQRDVGMLVLGDARQRRARLALAAGAQRHHLVGRQIAVGVEPREIPARRRDSRSRARPAPRAPWRGRPPPPRGRRRAAASATARRRATLEAKVVTATRPARPAINSAMRCAPHRLPRASGRRAPHWWNRRPRRAALLAEPRSLASSVGVARRRASDRSSSRRYAAPCRAGVRMISAFDSGIECAIETSSTSNGPTLKRLPSGTIVTGISGAPGSLGALGLEQRGGERRGIDRHLQLRPQIEQRAEMILVRMGEHDAGEVACAPRPDSGCPGRSGRCPADAPRRRTTRRDRRSAIAGGARRRGRRSTGSCRSRRRRRAARTPGLVAALRHHLATRLATTRAR